MNDGPTRATLILLVGGVSAAAAACCIVRGGSLLRLVRGWRSKTPEEMERLRRLDVNRRGRITSAQIVDCIENNARGPLSRVVVYRYEVAGVTYEADQEVSAFSGMDLLTSGAAGLASSVKYDPQKPINSIIACEEWSGLRSKNPGIDGGPKT